jgi:hypothetical protein
MFARAVAYVRSVKARSAKSPVTDWRGELLRRLAERVVLQLKTAGDEIRQVYNGLQTWLLP